MNELLLKKYNVKVIEDRPDKKVFFELDISGTNLTKYTAMKIQESEGYHPDGYDFYSFKKVIINNRMIATWQCSNSCE